MKRNPNRKERFWGYVVLLLWIGMCLFYTTWDGWLYEWRECGYAGPNQHFDLDLLDMRWDPEAPGGPVYFSTNNLHSLLYICLFVVFMGWWGLLFNQAWARQGTMGTLPISVVALFSTFFPITDHLYMLQWVYDLVHVTGIVLGLYFFAVDVLIPRKTMWGMFGAWILYVFSRVMVEPWPFWSQNANGYFSVNQVNDMPFYFFGLEYAAVFAIILVVNLVLAPVQKRLRRTWVKVAFPVALFLAVGTILLVTGAIQIQNISLGTCP
ncbi:MAG TPA: hypothetical protein P5560_05125 [Thermotogota bacterium]|nr:hypothetical protein [Thermotogota bacterium]HRW92319.1 hypothetical protein [Thermotogota bacterium]